MLKIPVLRFISFSWALIKTEIIYKKRKTLKFVYLLLKKFSNLLSLYEICPLHISSYSVAETKETHFCAMNVLKVKYYFKVTQQNTLATDRFPA